VNGVVELIPRAERVQGELRLATLRLIAVASGIILVSFQLLHASEDTLVVLRVRAVIFGVSALYSFSVFILLRRGVYGRALPYLLSLFDVAAITASLIAGSLQAVSFGLTIGFTRHFGLYFILVFTTVLRHDSVNTAVVAALATVAYALAGLSVWGPHPASMNFLEPKELLNVALLAMSGVTGAYIALSYRRFIERSIAAERGFLESDLRLKGITSSLPAVLFQLRVDAAGRVHPTYVSETSDAVLGISPRILIHHPERLRRTLTRTAYRAILTRLGSVDLLQNPWTMEAELSVPVAGSPGQHKRWFRIQVRPAILSSGETLLNGIALDIQDMKALEMQLIDARNAAERANESKSNFLADVSHEFRTPLNGIIGMTDLLSTSELSPDDLESVETIRRSSSMLLTMITDLLDLSRVEAGNLTLEEEAFSLSSVVYQITGLLAAECAGRGVDLITEVPAQLQDTVRGDAGRVSQVLFNVVGNGIKFTHKGFVHVGVSQRVDEQGRFCTRFDVRDTGIGIDEDAQAHIFDKFAMRTRDLSRKYGGTGLGLSISQHLLHLMNGTISVQSSPGQGSHFTIEVPLPALEPEDSGAGVTANVPGPALVSRVLIVDDHEERRETLARIVRSAGPSAETACWLEDCTSWVTEVDVILVSSTTLARVEQEPLVAACRESAAGARWYVVADVRELSGARVQHGWADGFLHSPVNTQELLRSLSIEPSRSNAYPSTASEGAQPDSNRTGPVTGQMDVLFADDNELNRTVTARILERFGYRTATVFDGKQAVERARKERFSLIIIDFMMPEMNGLDAATAIRAGGANTGTPILLLTGQTISERDAELFRAAGIDRVMTKPLRLSELSQVTDRYLRSGFHPE